MRGFTYLTRTISVLLMALALLVPFASSSPVVAAGTWNIESVDRVEGTTSLALGFSGNPHISYYGYSDNEDIANVLKYAYFGSSAPTTPTVTTTEPTGTTISTGVTCGGNVLSEGEASVTERGVCWSFSENPTISDEKTSDGTGTGPFSSTMVGLFAHTTYHIRAYATNSFGTSYGADKLYNYSPVVLVHGWSDNSAVWDNMKVKLKEQGIPDAAIFTFDYRESNTDDPRVIADKFNTFISDNFGVWIALGNRFDIVCHSMGALVTRWWMEKMDKIGGGSGKNAEYVRQWIGIAPASHGSATADNYVDMVGDPAVNFVGQQAVVQLQTNSDTVKALDVGTGGTGDDGIQEGLTAGVKYRVMVGVNQKQNKYFFADVKLYVIGDLEGQTFDRQTRPDGSEYNAKTYLGDSFVSMNQSMLDGAQNEYFEGLDHNQMPKNDIVCQKVSVYIADPTTEAETDCNNLADSSTDLPETKGSDTALVMDISGSMGDSMEGETKLFNAQAAAKDLLGTIRNESMYGEVTHMVGLVTFTDNAHIDSSLTSNYQTMESVISGLTPQNSTNLEDGINQGTTVLKKSGTGRKKIMVLLSDGLPTSGETNRKLLLSGCVENAKRAGVVINTVGFGSDCDEDLLGQIADRTGGTYAYASNSFELLSAYIHIRHDSMGEVVLSENDTIVGAARKRKTFQVISSTGELNGTINWKGSAVIDSQLYDPKGRLVNSTYPGASLSRGNNYVQLIIRNPMMGTWELDVDLGAFSSRIPHDIPVASAGTALPGIYAAPRLTLGTTEGYGDSSEGTEFHVEVSTRGEKSEIDSYPKVLWIVLGMCALAALLLFLVINRRISQPLNTRDREGDAS